MFTEHEVKDSAAATAVTRTAEIVSKLCAGAQFAQIFGDTSKIPDYDGVC